MTNSLHVVSDGSGSNTYISMEDGRLLQPSMATVKMEAGSFNRVDLTFEIPSLDIRALLDKVTLVCPACGSNMTHPCHPPLQDNTVPDDAIYGD